MNTLPKLLTGASVLLAGVTSGQAPENPPGMQPNIAVINVEDIGSHQLYR